jgi:hypothetical protein
MRQLVLAVLGALVGYVGHNEVARFERDHGRAPGGAPVWACVTACVAAGLAAGAVAPRWTLAAIIAAAGYAVATEIARARRRPPFGVATRLWGVASLAVGLCLAMITFTWTLAAFIGLVVHREVARFERERYESLFGIDAWAWSAVSFLFAGVVLTSTIVWATIFIVLAAAGAAGFVVMERNERRTDGSGGGATPWPRPERPAPPPATPLRRKTPPRPMGGRQAGDAKVFLFGTPASGSATAKPASPSTAPPPSGWAGSRTDVPPLPGAAGPRRSPWSSPARPAPARPPDTDLLPRRR